MDAVPMVAVPMDGAENNSKECASVMTFVILGEIPAPSTE